LFFALPAPSRLTPRLGKDPQSELPGTKFSIEYLKVLGKDFLNILLDPERTLWILLDNKQKGLEVRIEVVVFFGQFFFLSDDVSAPFCCSRWMI
jgi:hypothetical protein